MQNSSAAKTKPKPQNRCEFCPQRPRHQNAAALQKHFKTNHMETPRKKKPYNIDRWSEKDLGWKPCMHAETIEQAERIVIMLEEQNPAGRFRARNKDTAEIYFETKVAK